VIDRGVLVVVIAALALAIPNRRLRGSSAVIASLPLALTAIAEYLTGMAPFASLVVLIVAAILTLERARSDRPGPHLVLATLAAAAAATVAHAALVVALAVVIAGSARVDDLGRAARTWRVRIAAVALLVIGPYLLTTAGAWAHSPYAAVRRAVPAAIGAGLAGGLALALISALAVRERSRRVVLIAACASIGVAGALAPSAAAVAAYALPVTVALVLVVAMASVSGSTPPGTAAVAVTALVGLLAVARFQYGEPLLGWRIRAVQLIDDARAVGEVAPADVTRLAAEYAVAQRTVPPGARLAVWVDRPDLIQYDRNRVTDLRAPAVRHLGDSLARMRLDFVLVDDAATGDAWQVLLATSEETYHAGGLHVLAVGRHGR
jgi:hypothetical protein